MHPIDCVIIAVYLIGTITVGILSRGKQSKADDYFTARGEMTSVFQSLVVGLSLAATLFSGISFIAYPSLIYSYGLSVLIGLTCFPIAYIVVVYWFLPKFLKSNIAHPYDIIEVNLGTHARTIAAVMYFLLRIGWMAALVYAPTIAILAAGNLDDKWFWPVVLMIGLSSTLYTTLGGIRGLIITDAIQFVVIIVGVIVTIVFIFIKLPISLGQALTTINDMGHTKVNFTLDPAAKITFWTLTIGYLVSNLSNYTADQMSLQRYLSTGNIKSTAKSFMFNLVGATCVLVLLAVVGLSLVVWYKFVPDENMPVKVDKIFPYFVSANLPIGISGLLLAAILAATISSMTAGINALAASITYDFRSRFGKAMTPLAQLRFGKICSLTIGLVSTMAAGLVSKIGTIFDITQTLLGLFLGPLFACIVLAVMAVPINSIIMLIAVISGLSAGATVVFSGWAPLWVSPTTFITTLAISIAGTYIFGADKKKEG